ncbi:hypothetical protein GW819_01675 [Candidatus Gracilibacteria bacterium]|nr:hypothetical protein [bacterium]NDK19529.1 hypothetical protein [Candidatus Gracilibacteria bacterium]PIQ11906.1 MAG: hypothetical protein COW68_01350 [Candidatus Gracilibacteria bacterium CG18_big_fil_WC_8_21_14_2_50_38_16]PIQ41225.1 MAG: hypothetical protein COW06_03490 [Candidatus Gracilibacteria bacterium CG12_big_fil_rev_8_21_14_0_65_38_15]
MDISTYSKSELTTLLKGLKSYRALEKFVGKRGRAIFARERSGTKLYRVEYFGGENRSILEPIAIAAYARHFGETIDSKSIEWKQNDTIRGGIRIFSGDDMMDISFQEVENRLKR